MFRWPRGKRTEGSRRGATEEQNEHASQRTPDLLVAQDLSNSAGSLRNDGHPMDRRVRKQINPPGLTVLFQPENHSPSVDIVFVHGLGGTSMQTWSLDKDLEQFWPQEWLPHESNLRTARISTFGYDATWSSGGARNILSVSDFARYLLNQLRYTTGVEEQCHRIGKVPVIFVVHSMGGLVVKKAYVFGNEQEKYKEIIQSTCAILFLATPHRGADLARVLNRILKFVEPIRFSRQYIEELKRNSPALEDINEQFRHFVPRLEIFSFYETVPMKKGLVEKLILDKDSSILGYPGEEAIPLKTDHRGATKFSSRDDPSYIAIRNVLKDLVARFGLANLVSRTNWTSKVVRTRFGKVRVPNDDLEFFYDRRLQGSCEWILSEPSLVSWLEDRSLKPRIFWLYGRPGTGKSVLASHIVENLKKVRGLPCQFFYFRYDDRAKRSTSSLLWSIAYQVACQLPDFEQYLATLDESLRILEKAKDRAIWKTLFLNGLFKLRLNRPIYWIIDGLDESYTPNVLLSFLEDISTSNCPVRIMIVSRQTSRISNAFEKLSLGFEVDVHDIGRFNNDLTRFIHVEMEDPDIVGTASQKKTAGDKILKLADGNFLWARLVLEALRDCYDEAHRSKILESLLPDLKPQYQHMVSALSESWKDGHKELAKAILTWAVCSGRPLTLPELSRALALGPSAANLIDLQATVSRLCGDFIQVDGRSRFTMVHHTAREYLTKSTDHELHIDASSGHRMILKTCLSVLMDPNLTVREENVESEPFLEYATTSLAYHLTLSGPATDDELLHLLVDFFKGPSVLRWICMLPYTGQLQQVVRVSKALSSFLLKGRSVSSSTNRSLNSLTAENTLRLWAIELLRVVAKFGKHLLLHPKAIYDLIPPFCPSDSMLRYHSESRHAVSSITVTGLSNHAWDDSIVKFAVERHCRALSLSCVDQYFAISTSSLAGNVRVFHTTSCEEAQKLCHLEPVVAIQFSKSGHLIATYGQRTTKVWKISTAQVVCTVENPLGTRILAIGFQTDDTAILTCSNDGVVRKLELTQPTPGWQSLGSVLTDGGIFRARRPKVPGCAAFNQDNTLLAVAFPGGPVAIWNVSNSRFDAEYEREINGTASRYAFQTNVVRIGWNTESGHVYGVYNDGCIFKWHPFNHEPARVLSVDATIVKCSPTGSFLLTGDDDGTLKIWAFEDFSLLYKLSCTSTVNDVAIDSDGKRLYDLRGSYCNIWEPDSLIRLAEPDDKASETSSTSTRSSHNSHVSESFAQTHEPIQALAVGPLTFSFCTGHSDGAWKIFKSDGELLHTETPSSLAIEHVMWSDNENYLAVADVGTGVHIKHISKSLSSLTTIFQERLGKPIHQILFNKPASLFLAATEDSLYVWPLGDEPCLRRESLLSMRCQWVNHPYDERLLVGVGPEDIRVVRWHDLKQLHTFSMSMSAHPLQPRDTGLLRKAPSESLPAEKISLLPTTVRKILVSGSGSWILLHFNQDNAQCTQRNEFGLLRTTDLEISSMTPTKSITAFTLPESLRNQIDIPLGFLEPEEVPRLSGRRDFVTSLAEDQLIFLNKSGWLCTLPLHHADSGPGAKRHFFLPQDWLDEESLELAQVTKAGTLMCPKDGEVGIIRNGFKNEWLNDTKRK